MYLTTYQGSCHCGRVTFELKSAPITHVLECNCSICRRAGTLWTRATDADLKIVGESELGLYQFGTMRAKHYFCRSCGVRPFTRPRLDPTRWAVNVRCIDGVDLASLKVTPFDGQNWEAAAKAFLERAGKR